MCATAPDPKIKSEPKSASRLTYGCRVPGVEETSLLLRSSNLGRLQDPRVLQKKKMQKLPIYLGALLCPTAKGSSERGSLVSILSPECYGIPRAMREDTSEMTPKACPLGVLLV